MIRRILVATMWGLGTWCLGVSLRMLGAKIGRVTIATSRHAFREPERSQPQPDRELN